MTGNPTEVDGENEVKGKEEENFLAEGNVVVVENDLDQTVAEVGDHDQADKNVQVFAQLEVGPVVLSGHVEGVVEEGQGLVGVRHEPDHHHRRHQCLLPDGLEVPVAAPAVPNDLVSRPRR